MSHYEQFRSSLSARLLDRQLPPKILNDVLQDLDAIAAGYDITRQTTDLIVSGSDPQIVQLYCAALAVENKAKGTIADYYRILSAFLTTVRKPFQAITTNDIRVYMFSRQQQRNLKKSSLEHLRVVINAFFQWLVDEEYLARNPARRIQPIKVPRSSRQAIPALDLEYLRQACRTPREKALIDFLYASGCRVSECAALELSDINWATRAVTVRHGKGDKFRVTYFNAEAEVSLRAYLDARKGSSAALFCASRAPYGHISRESLETEVRHIRARADQLTVTVTPHVLRHTFATSAINNGAPVQHVQQLLGHASLDTTMIYTHNNQADVQTSHRKFVT